MVKYKNDAEEKAVVEKGKAAAGRKDMTLREYLDLKGIELTPLADFPPEPQPKPGSDEPADNDVYEHTFFEELF